MNIESAVLERYSQGADKRQEALCCPVDYDKNLLTILPQEILDKDYGCGDPSRFVRTGDIVLDLGSGGGKICFMAAQLVGPGGKVIGVDMNDDMLRLARKYQPEMAERLGGDRVRFVKGRIQDLALDIAAMENWLKEHPVNDAKGLTELEQWQCEQRLKQPLIETNSVDLVISNCVLNLVSDVEKKQLVNEIFRVLKPGGRMAISDIVCDEPVPCRLKADKKLWSGCISGAFQEQEMMKMFAEAGFQALCFNMWSTEPWRVIENIEFRSVTLTGVKPEDKGRFDYGHAVIYRGPFDTVYDDDGNAFPRGERIAVCERTFRFLMEGPYKDVFIGIAPAVERDPVPWCAPSGTKRPVTETKGGSQINSDVSGSCCC